MSARKPPPDGEDLDALEAKINRLRALGVTEYEGIKLGPLPPPKQEPLSREQLQERAEAERIRQRDIMFAASHIKPALRLVKP